MLFLVYVIAVLLFTILKRKKNTWFIYAIFAGFLVWTCDGTQSDFEGYYDIFERINNTGENLVGAGLGWFWLCRFFGSIGLNYHGMVLVLVLASCYLLHSLFLKFDLNENVTWTALLIFPLLINCIQIRFFFAMAIILYFLKYLLFESKYSLIIYSVGVLIATSVHTGAAIFSICILIILYEHHSKKTNFLITCFIGIVAVVCVCLGPRFAKGFLRASQYSRYIEDSISKSSVKWCVAIIICWLISMVIFKYIGYSQAWKRSKEVSYGLNKEKRKLFRTIRIKKYYKEEEKKYSLVYVRIQRIIYLLGLTIPLLIFDRNFYRYIQMGYILDALCLGIYWRYASKGTHEENDSKWKVLICYGLAMLPAIYSITLTPVNVTEPLFTYYGLPSIFR